MSLFIAIYPLTHPIIAKWNTPLLTPTVTSLRLRAHSVDKQRNALHWFPFTIFSLIAYFSLSKTRYVWNAICFTWRSPNSDRSTGIKRIVEIYKKSEVVDMGIPHVSMIKRNLSVKEIFSNMHFLDTFLAAVICHYSRKSPNVSCTNDTSDTRQN